MLSASCFCCTLVPTCLLQIAPPTWLPCASCVSGTSWSTLSTTIIARRQPLLPSARRDGLYHSWALPQIDFVVEKLFYILAQPDILPWKKSEFWWRSIQIQAVPLIEGCFLSLCMLHVTTWVYRQHIELDVVAWGFKCLCVYLYQLSTLLIGATSPLISHFTWYVSLLTSH